MNILSVNSKTGVSLNMPAPATCSPQCLVKDICYARKGRFTFKNVVDANNARLDLYLSNPREYFSRLSDELTKLERKGVTHVRIFGSGDAPNLDFMLRLIDVMRKHTKLRFWVQSVKFASHMFQQSSGNMTIRNSLRKGDYHATVCRKGHKPQGTVCPATSGKVSNCAECGHMCWSKSVEHVTYLEH